MNIWQRLLKNVVVYILLIITIAVASYMLIFIHDEFPEIILGLCIGLASVCVVMIWLSVFFGDEE